MTLTRLVGGQKRFYTINVFINLLGDWCIVRMYGSCKQLSPKGVIVEYFSQEDDANNAFNLIVDSKIKKGYQ